MPADPRIVVVGLGYVGLPLAVALARHFETVGFDIDRQRVAELRNAQDRTGEVDPKDLKPSKLALTSDAGECAGADIYIVTVPTPSTRSTGPTLARSWPRPDRRKGNRPVKATDHRL